MWFGIDQAAKAIFLLPEKIWYRSVGPQQVVPVDGKAA
jgi:hypothetical protein